MGHLNINSFQFCQGYIYGCAKTSAVILVREIKRSCAMSMYMYVVPMYNEMELLKAMETLQPCK